jgi:poly-gamma-glutamate capsule biosynthesis protein CapA/YwtB (metallophosphatase superfamily)
MTNMGAKRKSIVIGLAGDVVIDRKNPHEVFTEVRELLSAPDILFANLESPYSDAPGMAMTSNISVIPAACNLDAYAPAGFHVMSMANNHIVDGGHEVMLETRARLIKHGIVTCGVGENIEDARRPAILERGGVKVGFLAYASVFPHGYQARSNVPGLVPLRAHNHFHEPSEMYAPGTLPQVETIPDMGDHRNMEADIAALRKDVDFLAMSFHWGDFRRPFVLTDHELRTARLCIDRGADLVIGHHHHSLRGMEWYKGRPVFYGLGHLVFDLRLTLTKEVNTYLAAADAESYSVFPREGWPLLPLHPDTRMTVLGWVLLKGNSIAGFGFVPCRLRPDGGVVAVDPESSEGREVIEYVVRCNDSQKLNGKIVSDGAPMIGGHRSLQVVALD